MDVYYDRIDSIRYNGTEYCRKMLLVYLLKIYQQNQLLSDYHDESFEKIFFFDLSLYHDLISFIEKLMIAYQLILSYDHIQILGYMIMICITYAESDHCLDISFVEEYENPKYKSFIGKVVDYVDASYPIHDDYLRYYLSILLIIFDESDESMIAFTKTQILDVQDFFQYMNQCFTGLFIYDEKSEDQKELIKHLEMYLKKLFYKRKYFVFPDKNEARNIRINGLLRLEFPIVFAHYIEKQFDIRLSSDELSLLYFCFDNYCHCKKEFI